MIRIYYQAVTAEKMKNILGNNCSVDSSREGYVIGPDINNRLCHVASCVTFQEALKYADTLNKNTK